MTLPTLSGACARPETVRQTRKPLAAFAGDALRNGLIATTVSDRTGCIACMRNGRAHGVDVSEANGK